MHHSPSHSSNVDPECDIESTGSIKIFDLDNHHSPSVSPVTEVVASRTRSHHLGMQPGSRSLLSAVQRTVEARWLDNYAKFSKPNSSSEFVDDGDNSSVDSEIVVDYTIEPYMSDNELDISDDENPTEPGPFIYVAPDPNSAAAKEDDIDDDSSSGSFVQESYPAIDVSSYQENDRFIIDKSDITYMRIWDCLDSIHAPLYAFDKLLRIIQEETSLNGFDPTQIHPSRAGFMHKMKATFGDGVAPVLVNVPMEHDVSLDIDQDDKRNPRDNSDVFVFNATQQVFSLLEDEGIMGDLGNLAICPDNPFGRYRSPDG